MVFEISERGKIARAGHVEAVGRSRANAIENAFHPERWAKVYDHWMDEHSGLVHQPPALVGTPDSGVVSKQMRRSDTESTTAFKQSDS